jgi:hypothetical protein
MAEPPREAVAIIGSRDNPVVFAPSPEPVWAEDANVTAAMALAEELPGAVPVCPDHHKAMKASSKFGGFFCAQRNADGSWCKRKAA